MSFIMRFYCTHSCTQVVLSNLDIGGKPYNNFNSLTSQNSKFQKISNTSDLRYQPWYCTEAKSTQKSTCDLKNTKSSSILSSELQLLTNQAQTKDVLVGGNLWGSSGQPPARHGCTANIRLA